MAESEVEGLVLEFTRAERAGEPHAFRFAPQQYLLRTPGGGFESALFPWTPELLQDLRAVRDPDRDPEVVHRIGEVLRAFLASAGWDAHERAIVRAVRDDRRFHITVRSAAAELYALPWELLTLRSTGQLIGGIPGLLVRYEWPETSSFPDRSPPGTRRGRVLYAWSAAGGSVPAADHLAALRDALGERFDGARDVIAHASFAAIAEALAEAKRTGPPIDALHLLCHGAATGGAYGLALDDEAAGGRAIAVDAGRLQQLIAPHAGMLRLVVIVACDSGNTGEPGNHLGSVAQMIHRAGVPALVASRFPLSAAGSSRFTAAFYPALAREHTTLESAFLQAREVLVRDPGQLDWASLQLYSRASDGDATHPLVLGPPELPAAVPVVLHPEPLPSPPPITTRPRRWPLALVGVLVLAAIVGGALALGGPEPQEVARVETPAPVVAPAQPETQISPPPAVTPPPVTSPPVETPVETAPVETSPPTKTPPRKTPPAVPPTVTPSTPGQCPSAVTGRIGNAFDNTREKSTKIEMTITVSTTGKLTVARRSGDASHLPAARELLDKIDAARLVRDGKDKLPCVTTVPWLP